MSTQPTALEQFQAVRAALFAAQAAARLAYDDAAYTAAVVAYHAAMARIHAARCAELLMKEV